MTKTKTKELFQLQKLIKDTILKFGKHAYRLHQIHK